MRTVEFRHLLDEQSALRVRFVSDRGQVVEFVVQLECVFEDGWVAVVRYDTVHGFAHCDWLHPYEPTTKTTMNTRNYNEALSFALSDLAANWERYHGRYEEWLKQR